MLRYICFLMILLLSLRAYADSTISVGRYSQFSTAPAADQIDLFSVIVQTQFPLAIKTVGQAIENVLLNSGYKLANTANADPNEPILLQAPLPAVQRSIGPVSLRDALRMLAGNTWSLVIDPVHRLVSFQLKSVYRKSRETTNE